MVGPIVVDTDIASLSHKGRLSPEKQARLDSAELCLSFATVGELTEWQEFRNWGPRRRAELTAWIDKAAFIPYDDDVPEIWGELSAAAQKRGRPVPENDTWIAACCISRGLPLMTGNVKHFADFAEHHGLVLVTD